MLDFLKISSKDNDIIKQISQLQKSSKYRKECGIFVLEGLRLCVDAVENGFYPETVVATAEFISENETVAAKLFENSNKNYEITDNLLKKISDTTSPQGVLCLYKIPSFKEHDFSQKGKFVVLENIQDPSNLGAISRTAEAFGIDGIIVDGGCDPYSPKSLRASMGALLRLPVYVINNSIDFLKSHGVSTYASVVNHKNAEQLGKVSFNVSCAVYIGNEANGLSSETISKCDKKITIPMGGRAESLNAAVAASIIMWEISKC